MSAKDLKALMRHSFEEWNKGRTAAMAVIDETKRARWKNGNSASNRFRDIGNRFRSLIKQTCQYQLKGLHQNAIT